MPFVSLLTAYLSLEQIHHGDEMMKRGVIAK
jgi:hypothetical protein